MLINKKIVTVNKQGGWGLNYIKKYKDTLYYYITISSLNSTYVISISKINTTISNLGSNIDSPINTELNIINKKEIKDNTI